MQKVAIVGFGAMGQMHAKCYNLLRQAKVVAIVDSHPEEARVIQQRLDLGNISVFPSLEALLESENDVNIIDICLPTDMHIPLCLQAISAGKHVFCEKPFAALSQDPTPVIEAAKRRHVFLMIGHCIRFWPEYQHLESLVKSKEHGRLLSLTMQRRSSPPLYSKGNWLQNNKRSGGAILDLHIHDTDYILHLLGQPASVFSVGTKDSSGWSHVFTTYQYRDVAVTAEGGWNYPSKWGFNMSFQALFENALLEFDFCSSPTLKISIGDKAPREVKLPRPRTKGAAAAKGRVVGNINDLGGYFNELEYFIKCCDSNQAPKISTGRDAINTLKVIGSELESLATRQLVSFKK